MKLAHTYSHRFGLEAVKAAGVYGDITAAIDAPGLAITAKSGTQAKQSILGRLTKTGWAPDPHIAAGFTLDVNAMKASVCLTTQTGNVARAFYDLMKFEALHKSARADAAVLIVPTKAASKIIGSNIAAFERIRDEMELFRHVVTVPLLLLAFE